MQPDPMIPDDRPDRLRSAMRLAAGLAVLTFFALAATPMLLAPGDGATVATPSSTPSVVVETASATGTATASQVAAAQVIETFEVFGGKNPFERPALVGVPRVDTTATTAAPSGDGATDGGTDAGTGGDTATDGQTGTTTSTTTPVETDPVRDEAVALIEVFDDAGAATATVRVGSTAYRVQEDQVFAGSYRVVSLDLDTGCGTFLYGDSRFDLCEGQEILK